MRRRAVTRRVSSFQAVWKGRSFPGGGQTGLWVSGWARWGGCQLSPWGLVEGFTRPSLGRTVEELTQRAASDERVQLAVRRLEEEFPLQWVPLVLQLLGDCL